MPQISETNGLPPNQLFGPLLAGLEDIAQQRSVSFSTYTRYVLPLDGFVFWLLTGQFEAKGVLHWQTQREQDETEIAAHNSVVFTTTSEIVALNATPTETLIVGEIEGVRYSFRAHSWYFGVAGVWHYTGEAIVPAFATQFLDSATDIDAHALIVSDSMPAWLSLLHYTPVWLAPLNPLIPLYPSFAVPDNLAPPYGAVHIEPNSIRALQAMPSFDKYTTHSQLTAEQVRVTLYGCNNSMALDFLDLVERYSLDQDVIGIMNMPTVKDDKRPWAEGMILAQKKTLDFEVSYIQRRVNDIARQLIRDATLVIIPRCCGGPDCHP